MPQERHKAAVSAVCAIGPAIVYLIVAAGTCSSQDRCEFTGTVAAATASACAVTSAVELRSLVIAAVAPNTVLVYPRTGGIEITPSTVSRM